MYNYASGVLTNDITVNSGNTLSTTTVKKGTGSLSVSVSGLTNSSASWIDSQNKSFSVWFYTTSLTGHTNGSQEFLRYSLSGNVIYVFINDNDGIIHVSLNGTDVSTGIAVSVNTWYHFVWVVSGPNNSAIYTFYLNNGTPTTLTNQSNPYGGTRTNLWIGSGSGNMPISGYIDDFRIYDNIALNASQVSALYNYTLTSLVPSSISGLKLWLDATDIFGNGTTATNGSTYTSWADKSGQGNNASSSIGITWNNNTMNSLPSFYINLPSSYTNTFHGNLALNTYNLVFFIVGYFVSNNGYVEPRILSLSNSFTSWDANYASVAYSATSFFFNFHNNKSIYIPVTSALSTPILINAYSDNTNSNLYMNVLKNGTTFSSTSGGDGLLQSPSVYIIGCGYSSDLEPVQMYISEVLVYDMSVINGDKIASITAYLRSKWNI